MVLWKVTFRQHIFHSKKHLLLLLCFLGVKASAFVPSTCRRQRSCGVVLTRRRSVLELVPALTRLGVDPPDLIVVIPAYNEQDRIAPTLRSYLQYLEQSDRWNSSILVVDDGSTDCTVDTVRRVASAASSGQCPISCFSLPRNQGKGAALAVAMAHVDNHNNCSLILTADADGSADVASLDGLYEAIVSLLLTTDTSDNIWTQPAIVCGYRTYDDTAKGRLIFRWGFRTTVNMFCGDLRTRDSQCGFKLMTAVAAKQLYHKLHLTRWSHDVEVLYRAKLLGVPVTEAPVRWQDKDGSKLTAEGILKVASRMFYDVCLCRLSYAAGWWQVESDDGR
jgi:dolichyl-phosphate beta-glucosyltransferase